MIQKSTTAITGDTVSYNRLKNIGTSHQEIEVENKKEESKFFLRYKEL